MSRAAVAYDSEAAHSSKSHSSNLRVNKPGDAYEREADLAADQVVAGRTGHAAWSLSRVSMQAPLQRECSCGGECEDCKEKKLLQREAHGAYKEEAAPPAVDDVLRGSGHPLDSATRGLMESRFGYDFGRVRIFHNAAAAHSAKAVAANAYTVGEKIVFNQGRYAPESHSGRRLLAHELAHVVQQVGAARGLIQRDDEDADAANEPKPTDSLLTQAYRAADTKHWELAARLANKLTPYERKYFLEMYKDPELRTYLHQGAIGSGEGAQSPIGQATEASYKAVKHKEQVRYAQTLAKQNGTPPPAEDGSQAESAPPPRPLTVEEKKQKCQSGEPRDLKVFPLRMPHGLWRISVAPISAHRSDKDIVVSQPLNAVLGDPMFHREVKTLPLSTFTGGVHLAPDEVVRVRVYDDNERLICVTGEQMLKLSDATDTAVLISILGTALDAASVMAPGVGQGLSRGASLALGGATILANEGLEVARQESAVHYGLQDKVDWAQIGFETLLQAVTLGFGGKLTDAAAEKVAGVAMGAYSRPALKLAVEAAMQGSVAVFQSAARALFNRLRGQGKEMTVGGFLEELAGEFAQGALLHAIMSNVSHGEPGMHGEPEGGSRPRPPEEHSAPPPAPHTQSGKPTQPPGGSVVHGTPHPEPIAAHHEQSGPRNMAPEAGKSTGALRQEEALATKPVIDPEGTEQHKVIATKNGIGRCSEAPCPAIPVVYKKELAENPEFQKRYEGIRKTGVTDVEAATAEAALFVRDIEASRRAAAEHAQEVTKKIAPQLADAEAEFQAARQATLDYQATRKAAGQSLKGGPSKRLWNAQERIWILKRQQAYPDRTIFEQVRIVGVKMPDGSMRPISSISKTGRTPDFVELRGANFVAGDLKSNQEFLSGIKGGIKNPKEVEGSFRDSSKIGQQHKVENKVLKTAVKEGGVVVMQGRNVLSGDVKTIEIPVDKYKSDVLTYGEVRPN